MSPDDDVPPTTAASPRLSRRTLLAGVAGLGVVACTGGSGVSAGPSTSASTSAPPTPTTVPPAPGAPSSLPPVAGTATTAVGGAAGPGAPATASDGVPSTTTGPSGTAGPVDAAGPARFVRSGDPRRPMVALTFHGNGDPALVTELLDIVDAARVPITVFVVGQWLADNPTLGRRMQLSGHELANHTWSHPAMGGVSPTVMAEEITRCREVLRAQTGSTGRWFRPSGIEVPTDTILAQAGAAGYGTCVGYDVDSLDFTDPGADAVISNTAAGLGNGSIVSLHTGHADTVAAMPGLLALLSRRGLRPVTVATLLGT